MICGMKVNHAQTEPVLAAPSQQLRIVVVLSINVACEIANVLHHMYLNRISCRRYL
jgi:hypothetical protein